MVSEFDRNHVQYGSRLEVATVDDAGGAAEVSGLFDRVWGVRMMVSPEIIVACVHNGAYASLAKIDGQTVGAAFAFVGRELADAHGPNLHSHAAGVLTEWSGGGVGERLKQHQWRWARDNGFATVTWTFDPLVRRNAWFNLVRLGARALGYHENFYGELADGINAGEQSDRLLVRWDVNDTDGPTSGAVIEPTDGDLVIDTPPDIESLRAIDRTASAEWRSRQRAAFGGAGDRVVAGLTSSYSYVLRSR